jgi:hypothetical protein
MEMPMPIRDYPRIPGYDLDHINTVMACRNMVAAVMYQWRAIAGWMEDSEYHFMNSQGQTITLTELYSFVDDKYEEALAYLRILMEFELLQQKRKAANSSPVVDPIYFGL